MINYFFNSLFSKAESEKLKNALDEELDKEEDCETNVMSEVEIDERIYENGELSEGDKERMGWGRVKGEQHLIRWHRLKTH